MSKNWHKSNTYLPKYEEVVVCLYRTKTPIDGSDFCVRFNHRSNNPEVVTTENGWCDFGDKLLEDEPEFWIRTPDKQ